MGKLDNVICPFFATMLNTDILATKAAYSRGELLTFMMDAGVAENIAIGHVEANFAHIHSDMMNLFDMEGNPNEHQTSTGILDCPSSYQAEIGGSGNCTFDALVRNRKCSPVSAVSCINVTACAKRELSNYSGMPQTSSPKMAYLTGKSFVQLAFSTTREKTTSLADFQTSTKGAI